MKIKLRTLATTAFIVAASVAHAQTVEQFYTNRTINVIVPFSAGGIYDTTGRLVARNMGQFIPASRRSFVQNQPSGGGLGLANRFAAGESDGTLIGTLQRGLPQLALTGDPNVRFDPLKLTWIGSLSAYANDSYILSINSSHKVQKIQELQGSSAPLLRIGSNRAGSTNLTIALVVQHALGLKHEIVRGYPGAADINLAQQRNEVDGQYADVSFSRPTCATFGRKAVCGLWCRRAGPSDSNRWRTFRWRASSRRIPPCAPCLNSLKCLLKWRSP